MLAYLLSFLHGKGGSRLDALHLLQHVVPYGVSVFTFDFSAHGLSDGNLCTMGINEVDDIECALTYLR